MRYLLFGCKLSVVALLFSSCITQQSFQELEAVRDYYKAEAEAVDSISIANQELVDTKRELELELKQTVRELEELAVANNSLSRNYDEILEKYNRIVQQNENELTAYSYEKISLQEQLASQQSAMDQKERDLAQMEYDLYQKESRLSSIEYDYSALEGGISERDARIRELQDMLQLTEGSMDDLRAKLDNILRGFSSSELTVKEDRGRVYVSLSQGLLYRPGSDRLDPNGLNALKRMSSVLKDNSDVEIIVEGHTDADGSAESNWDLSVRRAAAVVKAMTAYGVDPTRITAAGRGEHLPVASNSTSRGKAENRRTEIILSPRLDELYQLINRR